jgi:pimeloyl-ACP methyl ester carboxylesterase
VAGRGGLLGVGLGVLGAGALVGTLVERRLVGRPLQRAAEAGIGFGTLHSPPQVVTADDGVELYVEVDPARPGAAFADLTVVFCHGFTLNLDVWHHQRLALSGTARTVFWDQRGHGRSGRPRPGGTDIDRLGRDLAAVLEATAPTGPVVLVGHSMGGMTIMALAAERPELFGDRVVGAGLLATSSGGMNDVSFGLPAAVARGLYRLAPGLLRIASGQPDLVDLGRRTGNDLEYLLTKAYSFGSDVPPATVDFVARLIAGTPVDVVAEFFPAFGAHDKATALAVLQRVETLVMVGEDDRLTPPEHSRAIARAVPAAELVVLPECGHLVLLEHPAVVEAHLTHLLERAQRLARSA